MDVKRAKYLLHLANDLTLVGCELVQKEPDFITIRMPEFRRFDMRPIFKVKALPIEIKKHGHLTQDHFLLTGHDDLIRQIVCQPVFVEDLHVAAFSTYGHEWFREEFYLGASRELVHCQKCGRNALYMNVDDKCKHCHGSRYELPF
jgi:hypothetical protein